jgi:hypothetical protein
VVPGAAPLIGLGLLLLAAGLVLERRRRRREARAFGSAATALSARHDGRTLHGEHEGVTYRTWYTPATRRSAPSVTVAITPPGPGDFRVARERAAHRLWRRIRRTRALSTGDPEFDREFDVTTRAAAFAAAVLERPDARLAVAALFQLRCSEVRHAGETLEARWCHVDTGALDPPLLRIAVSHLARLADATLGAPAPATVAPAVRIEGSLLATVPIVLSIVSLGLFATGDQLAYLDPGVLFVASLRWSLLALAGFLLLAAATVGGRPASPRELIAVAALALVAFPLAGFAGLRYANVQLDRSPPVAHAVRVLQKYRGSMRGATAGGWVEVESWRGDGREHIPLSAADWERISRTGPGLTVVSRAGRLGFEWVESYRIDDGS